MCAQRTVVCAAACQLRALCNLHNPAGCIGEPRPSKGEGWHYQRSTHVHHNCTTHPHLSRLGCDSPHIFWEAVELQYATMQAIQACIIASSLCVARVHLRWRQVAQLAALIATDVCAPHLSASFKHSTYLRSELFTISSGVQRGCHLQRLRQSTERRAAVMAGECACCSSI